MSWRRTLDENGNPILRNTETGEERPVDRVAPTSVAAPEASVSPPIQAPGPPSGGGRTVFDEQLSSATGGLTETLGRSLRGLSAPGAQELGRLIGTARVLGQPAEGSAVGSRAVEDTGSTIGAEASRGPPPLDFGEPGQLTPSQQALFDILQETLGIGGGAASGSPVGAGVAEPEVTGTPGDRAAADLDSATAFMSLGLPEVSQGDPGLALLAEGAREDRDRFTPLLERELARATEQRDIYSTDNPNRNAGYNIAMFLGRLLSGERGDVAGDMIRDRQGAEQTWTNRILELTEAGVAMDQAIRRADAEVLSDRYQTRVGLEQRDYERGVTERRLGQTDRQIAQTGRGQDQQLRVLLANMLMGALEQNEEANLAAAGTLLDTPYAGQAAEFAVGQQSPYASPETARILASTLSERALIDRAARDPRIGLSRGDQRQAMREIRRLYPQLNDEQILQVLQRRQAVPAE